MTPRFTSPVVGIIHPNSWPRPAASREFKVTDNGSFAQHRAAGRPLGIDIGNGHCGDPVFAMASGRVSMAGLLGLAKTVRIVHPQFPGYETGATHLATMLVGEGGLVQQGQQVGTLGMTGATACHLHQGCKYNGVEVDWLPFLDQSTGGDMPQIVKWEPGKASIKAGAKIRRSPSLADEAEWFVVGPKGSSASTFVGWVEGDVAAGSNLWGTYFVTADRVWAYTHKINVASVTPIVTGFTQAQVDAAVAAKPSVVGFTQAQVDAAVKAAKVLGRGEGIRAAGTAALATK